MKILATIVTGMIAQGVFAAGINIDPVAGIDMGGSPVTNLPEPEFPGDAATKAYIDRLLGISGVTGDAPVERTGQTSTYADGDDGNLQRGVPWPNPRFTDNQDGTVTDNLTGLVWLTKANCIATDNPGFDTEGTAGDGLVTWQTALEFVAGINSATYDCGDISNGDSNQTDWRLPNEKELYSLIDFSRYDPAVAESNMFSDLQSNWYWSSTTLFGSSGTIAWIVYFYDGEKGGGNIGSGYYVWPVRAGE